MGVIVISLGTGWIARKNFGCTWKCPQTNTEITNNLWELPRYVKKFIWRTAGIIQDSPDVEEQLISLNGEYDAWIIVHYQIWVTLATIFCNTVFIASLQCRMKEKGKWFKHKWWYTESITQLISQMISIRHGVDGSCYFTHLIQAKECRKS
jgi:hypothetical protein